MATPSHQAHLYLDQNMEQAEVRSIATGQAVVFLARCPDREGPNEDSAALIPVAADKGVLVVADGFGGHPAGDQASALVVQAIARSVNEVSAEENGLRTAILAGIDLANAAVLDLGVGAATTLAVVELNQNAARTYHVGDSEILIVGQRGKVKWRTVSHSPAGYAVESGLVDENEAMHHEERHVVSNMVGSAEMRIDIGPIVPLAPRDTVLLGSDGLFDNLLFDEIIEGIRKGDLQQGVAALARASQQHMTEPDADHPAKPDDLTIVSYRRNWIRRARKDKQNQQNKET
jgi:serine/threonine protein phosphatase PrpC